VVRQWLYRTLVRCFKGWTLYVSKRQIRRSIGTPESDDEAAPNARGPPKRGGAMSAGQRGGATAAGHATQPPPLAAAEARLGEVMSSLALAGKSWQNSSHALIANLAAGTRGS
jgi:hypothetical protein